ncbi:sensor histidine kinase [Roseomonas sp. 18066]|uniref:sensor histidine kinase n=1 Tax=Roseomonas sp. 18066 TaxID=2681412 RepID=UPI00135A5F8D|nr:sensor histidine kinase [Roseomonas sp. 18066]
MPRLFGSLTARLALLSAAWVSIGLGLSGCAVLGLVNKQLVAGFDVRVTALLHKAVNAALLEPDGRPGLSGDVPVPEFLQPFSGYYWQMEAGERRASSRSLWDGQLSGPAAAPADGALAVYDGIGPRGEPVRVAERMATPAGSRAAIRIRVGMNRRPLDEQISHFTWLMITSFAVIGLGLVVGGTLQLVWGMRPLRQARQALAAVRAGQQATLAHARAPSEIAPLLEEIDALVQQNHATVERARAHVGNLAHALKTPLAVQRVALEPGEADMRLAREQNRAMEMLVQHHLSRARSAALSGAAATDAAPMEVAEELATALRRIFANKDLEIDLLGDAGLRAKVDRQDLMEILGNLLENACQWARHQVTLTVSRGSASLLVTVVDDGPGLASADYDSVLTRGVRLDEAKPGSGLGLAITRDLVALYDGSLTLQDARPAGLLVAVTLPLSAAQRPGSLHRRSRWQAPA